MHVFIQFSLAAVLIQKGLWEKEVYMEMMEMKPIEVNEFVLVNGDLARVGDFVRYPDMFGVWCTGKVRQIVKDPRSQQEIEEEQKEVGVIFLFDYMIVELKDGKRDRFHIESEVTLAKPHQIW